MNKSADFLRQEDQLKDQKTSVEETPVDDQSGF